MLLGRNRAVDHAVDKAANGRHRGFEFMAHVADKAARQFLKLVEIARHIVKGYRQLVNFNTVVILRHTHVEIACGKLLRCACNRLERTGHVARNDE